MAPIYRTRWERRVLYNNTNNTRMVHGCMMSTEPAVIQKQFQAASAIQQPDSAVTTSVDIQNVPCKATVSQSESHTTRAQTQTTAL